MQIIVCDICHKHPASRRSYKIARRTDVAGSMEDIMETFDLCAEHELEMLRWYFELDSPYTAGVKLSEHIKECIENRKKSSCNKV